MYTATLAIDNNILPTLSLDLPAEFTARDLVEAAFIKLQTDQKPDPFKFTIDYFGYDHYQGVNSYLGYFVVSIDQYVTGASNYWDLYVNGKASAVGMDSYLVQPNDVVELKWIAVPAGPTSGVAAKVQRVQERRVAQG